MPVDIHLDCGVVRFPGHAAVVRPGACNRPPCARRTFVGSRFPPPRRYPFRNLRVHGGLADVGVRVTVLRWCASWTTSWAPPWAHCSSPTLPTRCHAQSVRSSVPPVGLSPPSRPCGLLLRARLARAVRRHTHGMRRVLREQSLKLICIVSAVAADQGANTRSCTACNSPWPPTCIELQIAA